MDLRKDIYFYADLASFPASGAANLLYVDSATSLIYIWNGASYVASGAGGLKYGGLWNATTNNPTITSGVGDTGEYYIVGTAGTTNIDGINDWAIGDWIIFGGSAWQKIDNSDKEGYTTVEDEGTPLTQRSTINFVGSGVTAADSGGKTVVTIAAGSSSGVFGIADTSGVYTYYATLTLAMASATAGQTIEMFADVTETGAVTITLKDGVNINGNGHTYTHSYAAGNSNTFQNISGAISCVISNLRVIRSGRANGTTGDYVLNATVNDSQFFFNGVFMESTYGNCVYLYGTTFQYKPHSGDLYAKAYLTAITTQGSITGFKGQSTSSGRGIYALGGVIDKCTGMSISGNGIDGGVVSNSYGFSTSGIGLGLAGAFYNCYGNSVTYRAGDGNAFYNCVLISSSGFAASNGQYRNCTLISASGNAAGPYLLNKHDNCYLESTSNVVVPGPYTGEFRNCTVVSLWNNAGGHAFTIGNGSIITNSHIKVENASANCINFGSAVTIKYASNVFAGATTAVNANVTQGVINTEDNQGNILL
jgi:hypothetical protein